MKVFIDDHDKGYMLFSPIWEILKMTDCGFGDEH